MCNYFRVLRGVAKPAQLCYNININKGETILTTVYQQLFTHYLTTMLNDYALLCKTIDQLKAQGKIVTITKLPSQVNNKRKSVRF